PRSKRPICRHGEGRMDKVIRPEERPADARTLERRSDCSSRIWKALDRPEDLASNLPLIVGQVDGVRPLEHDGAVDRLLRGEDQTRDRFEEAAELHVGPM